MTVDQQTALKRLLQQQAAVIGVVGLARAGLLLVRAFVDAVFYTMGFDDNRERVERLLRGEGPLDQLNRERLAASVQDGELSPSVNMARLVEADAVLICAAIVKRVLP